MTSRWVVEVAPRKDVPVRWRAFSLAIKNRGVDTPERLRGRGVVTLGALRVVEAVWAVFGISGPVMSPSPTGDEALDLWDHVVGLARCRSFFELKRSCTAPPQFGPPAT